MLSKRPGGQSPGGHSRMVLLLALSLVARGVSHLALASSYAVPPEGLRRPVATHQT